MGDARARIWRIPTTPPAERLRAALGDVLLRRAVINETDDATLLLDCADHAGDDDDTGVDARVQAALPPDADPAAPPVRALLLRLPSNRALLALRVRADACDDSLLDSIGAEVATLLAEQPASPPEASALAWWRHALAGAPRTELLPDHPRADAADGVVAESLALPADLAILLADADAVAASPASGPDRLLPLAAASLAAILHRFTAEPDVLIGADLSIPPGVRSPGGIAAALPLRLDLAADPDAATLLARARDAVAAAHAHRQVPFHRLAAIIDDSGAAAWDTVLPIRLAVRRPMPPAAAAARQDRSLRFTLAVDGDGGARLEAVCRSGRHRAETLHAVLAGWARMLDAMLRLPHARLAAIDVLTQAARHRLLVALNDTARDFPDTPAIRLIEAQAQAAPDRVALLCGGRETTYGELAAAAARLAAALARRGIGRGARVGLLLPRGPDMIVALLAVLRTGAAYLPLDPAFPSDRLGYMLADSGAALVLTHSTLLGRLDAAGPARFALDRDPWPEPAAPSPDAAAIAPEDAAYVIYTSGSTGRPKGVEVPHRALTNFLLSMRQTPGIVASDTVLFATTLGFDISGLEVYLPLLVGARVVIAAADEAGDGAALVRLIGRHAVSIVQAGPTRLGLMLDAGWTPGAALKILTGGEPVARGLADRLLAFGEVWNMYGPTETTIWSTCARIAPGSGPVPIGRPIANTQVYVLDAAGGLAPPGAPGELGIAGLGVAHGYVGQPALTAERFPPNPFGPGRLYRTGDLVRWRHDGTLDFLSRVDQQVKLRGFRIELGEVEAALLRHPAVKQAVVVLGRLWTDEPALIAYVVPADPQAWPAIERDLPALLAAWLPPYMLPQATLMLPALPLLPNGKLDRARLPPPPPPADAAAPDAPDAPPDGAAAGFEQRMTALWQSVLKLSSVAPDDNFFDLGGDSILALALMAEILRQTGQDLPITTIYDAPTPAAMASLLATGAPRGRASCLVPLKPGDGSPLFIAHGLGGSVMELRAVARLLDTDGPVYGIEARGLDGAAPPLDRVEDMATFHLQNVRRVQPHGPYRLVGFSFGGLVALEMAQQLRRAGETVRLLALLDTYPHEKYWPLRCRVAQWGVLARSVGSGSVVREVADHYVGEIARLPRAQRPVYLAKLLGKAAALPFNATFLHWFLKRFTTGRIPPSPIDPTATAAVARVTLAGRRALAAYRPSHYAGDIVFFNALGESYLPFEASLLWHRLARGLTVRDMPGDHRALVREGAAQLAEALSAELRRADTPA